MTHLYCWSVGSLTRLTGVKNYVTTTNYVTDATQLSEIRLLWSLEVYSLGGIIDQFYQFINLSIYSFIQLVPNLCSILSHYASKVNIKFKMRCSHLARLVLASPLKRTHLPPVYCHARSFGPSSSCSSISTMQTLRSILSMVSPSPAAPQINIPQKHEEDRSMYKSGGYCPVYLGEMFNNRYQIIQKLGFGLYSTVWLAKDYQ